MHPSTLLLISLFLANPTPVTGNAAADRGPVVPAGKETPTNDLPPVPAGPGGMPVIDPAVIAARRFAVEPSPQEVMEKAAQYNKVTPENIKSINHASNLRALLPTFSAQYGYGWHETAGTLRDPTLGMDSLSKEQYGGWGLIVGGTWDLATLAFNPAELQTYALHGMRNNLVKEVTRAYFARRQAVLQYLSQPNSEALAKLTLAQRIQEYEAILDGLTGGYFTKEMERRGLERIR